MSFNPPPLPPIQPQWGQFQVWWQLFVEALKAIFASQQSQIDGLAALTAQLADAVADIATAQAAAAAAQTTANTANTTANTANSTANTTKRNDKISASFTVPANVVTATDAGSDVTVTVAAHTRVYGDGAQLSVAGHTFTGKAYSTTYGIYYNDSTTSDTTPTYTITTNATQAQNNYATGRHRVAVVATPAAGDPDTEGGSAPPGGGKDDLDIYSTL